MKDPLKQGLKPFPATFASPKTFVEVKDPLKQGLKHIAAQNYANDDNKLK